jgi:hypothetical protein
MKAEEKETLYAARYCSLTSFPVFLDQHSELQCVDELYSLPTWLHQLEKRGCLVYL